MSCAKHGKMLVVNLSILPLWSPRNPSFPDPMKILSSLLAFASLASLGMGCAFTLVLGPIPALLGFAGFVALGALAVYLNPEL
jgi:hypothetical protein